MKISRGQIIANILCLLPFSLLAIDYLRDALTVNPIQALTLQSGRTAVNLLMLSLACRPLSRLLGLTALLKIRRTLGVYAFLYAAFHFFVFAGLDFEFNLNWIIDEIRFKPFIQIGLTALVLLIPLAITSLNVIRRRMGRIWQRLHRLAYLIAALAILHYYLASKGDFVIPAIYGLVFLILMLFRLPPLNRIRIQNTPSWLKSLNRFLLKA